MINLKPLTTTGTKKGEAYSMIMVQGCMMHRLDGGE